VTPPVPSSSARGGKPEISGFENRFPVLRFENRNKTGTFRFCDFKTGKRGNKAEISCFAKFCNNILRFIKNLEF